MTLLAEIVLVAVAAAGVAASIALLPEAAGARAGRRSPPAPPRPDQLIGLERLVITSGASARQVHAALRPLLAEIAARRLAARGRTLERLSDADAAEMLGERLWEIVRPARPFPRDGQARGVSAKELAQMIEALERL